MLKDFLLWAVIILICMTIAKITIFLLPEDSMVLDPFIVAFIAGQLSWAMLDYLVLDKQR